MKEKTTSFRKAFRAGLIPALSLCSMLPGALKAQNFCANEVVFWTETFGTGTTATSNPEVSGLTYQATGPLGNQGTYRVINNTQQKPEWHNSADHTGDANGRTLVTNGKSGTFFTHIVNNANGFAAGDYSASLFLMNVNQPGVCGGNAALPKLTLAVEYQNANNAWVALNGSPFTTAAIPITATPSWNQLGGVFTLPTTGTFIVSNIRVVISDPVTIACGNDFAIDDIKLATCPTGGPLPVQFLNITAAQKGSGVDVKWSTSSEINNKYFDVEKSNDGGLTWSIAATVRANGNSSVIKNYTAYDARPVAGYNYYRIKQIDLDGNFKYSPTVNVKITIDKTIATILSNPFVGVINIDFLSKANQMVAVTLFDMAGKKAAADRFSITSGSSRKVFDKASTLNKGMYILTITDSEGAVIYNNKLIKQ